MGAAAVPALIAFTGYQIYSGRQQAKEQKKALEASQNKTTPSPTPLPTATDSNATESMAQRQRKLRSLQYGFASTMTNKSPLSPAAIDKPMAIGLKTRLGQ